jgi:flagellar hook-associated protein 3 FlgL
MISTLATRDSVRTMIARAQVDIANASTEVTSGRHADVGKTLGATTARLIGLRQLSDELGDITTTNAIVSDRAQVMQSALSEIAEMASDFFSVAAIAQSSPSGRSLLVEEARAKLDRLTTILSTASSGAYLFGGDNTGVQPVADYLAPQGSLGRTAIITGFNAQFGMAPSDPAASSIGPQDMRSFLIGAFATEFEDAGWSTNFSDASAVAVRNRIAPGETVSIPVSANSRGIRELYSALVAVIDGGTQQLNAESFNVLVSYVSGRAVEASTALANRQSELGIVQERIVAANERMSNQAVWLTRSIAGLEDVDAAEVAMRLSLLTTKLETSYAVTARLQKLSLLNYL